MKKIIQLSALIVLLPLLGLAQGQSINKLFNKYNKVIGFELETGDSDINFDLESDNDFTGFLNDISSFSMLSFEKEKGQKDDLASFKTKLDKLIVKYGFESMIDIQSDGSFRLLTKKDKNGNTTDYLMITEGDEDASFILASADRKS